MKAVAKTLRIVAADDSVVVRHMLTTLFDSVAEHAHDGMPAMKLCAAASDGVQCVEMVREMRPDLVLLDLEMPRMGGMEVLDVLHREFPEMPIIMCSAYTARGASTTLEALARGAADYVTKPSGSTNPMAAIASLAAQLLPKIAALVEAHRRPHIAVQRLRVDAVSRGGVGIVGIGLSTGGPAALEVLLPRLPANFRVPIVIVQHMPKLFTSELAARLDRLCRMPVRVAEHGMRLLPGAIWFAPGDRHMEVAKDAMGAAWVVLHEGAPLHHCRPAVDHLFRSMAQAYRECALGLVMTGMGSDGLMGARTIAYAGGTVLAQDEASSAVWGMPGRVAEAGLAAAILPLGGLANELTARVQRSERAAIVPSRVWKETACAMQ